MTTHENDIPQEPDDEIRADFDAEDDALWELLGVVEDAPPSRDFVARTLARTREDVAPQGTLRRGPWAWWGGGAVAAAALIGAVMVFGGNGDAGDPTTDPARHGGSVAKNEDISDVVDLLRNLNDTDLLALEADAAEAVQDEYLGG